MHSRGDKDALLSFGLLTHGVFVLGRDDQVFALVASDGPAKGVS